MNTVNEIDSGLKFSWKYMEWSEKHGTVTDFLLVISQ